MEHRETSEHEAHPVGHTRSDQSQTARPWSDRPHGESDQHGGSGESSEIADAAHEAYDRLNEAGDEVRGHIERAAHNGRSRIASELRTVGEAASAAAERLKEEDHERIGGYVRGIRRQCDRAAEYLEGHDLKSLTSDVNRLARRNPALFVGGAVVLGLAAGRFLSAKPPSREDRDGEGERYEGGGYEPWRTAQGQSRQSGVYPDPGAPARPGVARSASMGAAGSGSMNRPAGGAIGDPMSDRSD